MMLRVVIHVARRHDESYAPRDAEARRESARACIEVGRYFALRLEGQGEVGPVGAELALGGDERLLPTGNPIGQRVPGPPVVVPALRGRTVSPAGAVEVPDHE